MKDDSLYVTSDTLTLEVCKAKCVNHEQNNRLGGDSKITDCVKNSMAWTCGLSPRDGTRMYTKTLRVRI